MPHVFISYSRKDTAFAERLQTDLNARGIVTWRDTASIVGGEDWYKSIVQGIHNAYAVVQVVTEASEESKWVQRESLYADQKDVPIIPALPKKYPLPFHLIATQPILFEDYDEGLAMLVAGLQRLPKTTHGDQLTLGPLDRDTEIAYLDFLLSQMKAELRTARYVNLSAEQQRTIQKAAQAQSSVFDEFELTFDRVAPAECVRGEQFDLPGDAVEDAREPLRTMGRAILLGDPGAGKTTTLIQMAIDMVQAAKQAPNQPLPVFVPLRSYTGENNSPSLCKNRWGRSKASTGDFWRRDGWCCCVMRSTRCSATPMDTT
jgi:hypothetical protein